MSHPATKRAAVIGRAWGQRIRKARQLRGFSVAMLAEFGGMSERRMRDYEAGRGALDEVVLCRLADGLGISVDLLRRGGGDFLVWAVGAKALVSPHVFDAPTQYPDELGEAAQTLPPQAMRKPGEPPHERAAPKPCAAKARAGVAAPTRKAPIAVGRGMSEEEFARLSRLYHKEHCAQCGCERRFFLDICTTCLRSKW